MTTRELAALLGLTVEVDLVAANGVNVPGASMPGGEFRSITIHETANPAVGADARMHRRFVANGGGEEHVSFTYAVDSRRAVQILGEDQVNYAQGTREGNSTSLSIETCINRDGSWPDTLDNLAKLVAAILVSHGKAASCVRQHYSWYGKDCPATIRRTPGGWEKLVVDIERYKGRLAELLAASGSGSGAGGGGGVGTDVYVDPVTGVAVAHGFLEYYRGHGGVEELGRPLTGEFELELENGQRYVVQLFERGLLHWRDGEAVGRARIGAMWGRLAGVLR